MTLKILTDRLFLLNVALDNGDEEYSFGEGNKLYIGGPEPECVRPAGLEILKEAGWEWSALHECWVTHV